MARVGDGRRRERKERGRERGWGGKLERGRRLDKAGPGVDKKRQRLTGLLCARANPTSATVGLVENYAWVSFI